MKNVIILVKKACSQFNPEKVGLPAKKYFVYPCWIANILPLPCQVPRNSLYKTDTRGCQDTAMGAGNCPSFKGEYNRCKIGRLTLGDEFEVQGQD